MNRWCFSLFVTWHRRLRALYYMPKLNGCRCFSGGPWLHKAAVRARSSWPGTFMNFRYMVALNVEIDCQTLPTNGKGCPNVITISFGSFVYCRLYVGWGGILWILVIWRSTPIIFWPVDLPCDWYIDHWRVSRCVPGCVLLLRIYTSIRVFVGSGWPPDMWRFWCKMSFDVSDPHNYIVDMMS